MDERQIHACVVTILVYACISSSLNVAADDGTSDVILLQARDAATAGGVRFFTNPERLGFPKIDAQAIWRLRNIRPGLYDLDLTYSAGGANKGTRLGTISVETRTKRYRQTILATGRWDRKNMITIEMIPVEEGSNYVLVRVVDREPRVGTVLDLWSMELAPTNLTIYGAGKILRKETAHGSYVQYIPRSAHEPIRILALIHGTVGERETALDAAEGFMNPFISAAKHRGVILVAPAFDQQDYGGRAGPGGGYRGLFGREIRADEFLNKILDEYKDTFPEYDGKIYLYGHSAGGQFVSRYVVMHPERIIGAVISAAGTFAFPDPNAKWADGMARLRRMMLWAGETEPRQIDIQPDSNGWLEASLLSITAIVGEHDDRPHVETAQRWVQDMNALAAAHGKRGKTQLEVVEGVGHNSAQLAPTGIRHLFEE